MQETFQIYKIIYLKNTVADERVYEYAESKSATPFKTN